MTLREQISKLIENHCETMTEKCDLVPAEKCTDCLAQAIVDALEINTEEYESLRFDWQEHNPRVAADWYKVVNDSENLERILRVRGAKP